MPVATPADSRYAASAVQRWIASAVRTARSTVSLSPPFAIQGNRYVNLYELG